MNFQIANQHYCNDQPNAAGPNLKAPGSSYGRSVGSSAELECDSSKKPASGAKFVRVECRTDSQKSGKWVAVDTCK